MSNWYRADEIVAFLSQQLESEATPLQNHGPHRYIHSTRQALVGDQITYSHPLYQEGSGATHSPITMEQQLENLLGQVSRLSDPPRKLLIPIQIKGGGRHWVSLAVDLTDRAHIKAAYINSFGPDNQGYRTENDSIQNIVRHVFPNVELATNRGSFQHDGHSCGPITVEMLRLLANTPDIVSFVNQEAYLSSFENVVELRQRQGEGKMGPADKKKFEIRPENPRFHITGTKTNEAPQKKFEIRTSPDEHNSGRV